MKSDVKRLRFDGARKGQGVSVGGVMLKALLLGLSVLPLSRTPVRAQADDASRVQTPAPTATADAAKWERYIYTYPGEEFSVELPGTPFDFRTTRHVNGTRSDSEKVRVFGLYSEGVIFIIVSYSNPRDKETFDDFLGYTGDGGGSIGNLTPKGNVTLEGFEGREYAHPEGLAGARVFRAKKNAYLVKAYSKTANDPKVARFLKSFSFETKNSGRVIDEFKAEAARIAQAAPPAASVGPETGIGPGRGEGRGAGRGEGIGPGRGEGIGPGRGLNPGPYAGGGGPNRVFGQKEVTSRSVLVYKPEPGYTEEARQDKVTGVVRLRAILSSTGRVTNIYIIKPLPDGLTEKAIYAARHLLFFPAMKDGREVSQYVVLEYNFSIY